MKKENTASFMLRFNQKIYKDSEGETQVQWRGKISHVQGNESVNFSGFEKAIEFIQEVLANLTAKSVEDQTIEDKENILEKSIGIWKMLAKNAPKMVMETIKDPMAQVENIQGQIKEGISELGDEINQRIEMDSLKVATKSDYNNLVKVVSELSKQVEQLSSKIDKIK